MSSGNFSDFESVLRILKELREELETLTSQRVEALNAVTYTGMTEEQEREYDALRERILKVTEQLLELERSESAPGAGQRNLGGQTEVDTGEDQR